MWKARSSITKRKNFCGPYNGPIRPRADLALEYGLLWAADRSAMNSNGRNLMRSLNFYLLKLPCIFILMAFGLIFETLLSMPFIIACRLDAWLRHKK